ncbi:MAG: M81 family metallopeptidase [Chloroflexi bacterium]|nr:M81 family metallopeptidase [Chloroflexota bacterium]
MRVAIGGFSHETNTFNPTPTTLERVRRDGVYVVGDEVLTYYRGTGSTMGGIIDGCDREGLDMVPIFFATHGPSTGAIESDVIHDAANRLARGIADAAPAGILLHLHGAAAGKEIDDPELHILRAIRQAVGSRIPLVVVFDLHANIGLGWAEYADAIIGYKTAPHIDTYELGQQGATLIARALRSGVRPVCRLAKPPILVKSGLMSMSAGSQALMKPPMYWLVQRAAELAREPGVLDVTVAAGFGDADVPESGMTMLATTDGDRALGDRIVAELAQLAWSLRSGFRTDLVLTPVETAVRRAIETAEWPVILADQGNNSAGGSPGDGTAILAALKRAGWPDAALFICDGDAVREAARLGIGGTFAGEIGGKLEPLNGDPVSIEGTVRLLFDGSFIDPHFSLPTRLGLAAVIRCGATDVILTERPSSQIHPQYFRVVGIEPKTRRIIVVQSAHLFRDQFQFREPIGRTIIEVDSPGITNPDARAFMYHRLRRPIFPLDDLSDDEARRSTLGLATA